MEKSIDRARFFADRSVALAMSGPGSAVRALDVIERRYGLSRRTIEHIRSGQAKDVWGETLAALRRAYLDLCDRKVRALRHEIELERALGRDDYQDLDSAIEILSGEIARRRGQS